MWGSISSGDCSALYRLVATSPSDLVIKTDRRGRIVHATAARAALSTPRASDPLGRHLLDLIHPSYADIVLAEHGAALTGSAGSGWIELIAMAPDGSQRWMELKLGGLPSGVGALGVMRSIEDRRTLENRLFAASLTDPLTGLSNRTAFSRMLAYLVESGAQGHLALFDLDYFRSINLRHGHSGGDRLLIAFARLLQSLLRADDILSRIDGGTFGVLLPDAGRHHALGACGRVIAALRDMAAVTGGGHRLSASAGVAPFRGDADATLREGELALLAAKARGRARVESARGACLKRAHPNKS